MPEVPKGLVGYAKRKFIALAKELSQMKVITKHDSHILEMVSKEFAIYMEMEKVLKKDGYFYHGKISEKIYSEEDGTIIKEKIVSTNLKSHPALIHRNQAFANIMKGLQECGLTPSTRSKLKVVKETQSNPFAAMRANG